MFTRPLAALCCLLFSVFTLSCGPDQASPPSSTDAPTEVLLWHGMFTPQMQSFLKRTIAAFNETHADIQVQIRRYEGHQDEAARRLQLMLALDERPDVAWLPPPYTGDLAQSGALRPVADFLKTDTSFNADDFFPWLWEISSYNGMRYTLPYQTNSLAVLYNKRLFREAGIAPPETWDELARTARRLTNDFDGNGTPDQHGLMLPLGQREWTVWTWETFLWQAGGQFLSDDQQAPAFHSPAGQRALQFWVDLVHKHKAACLSAPEEGWNVTPFIEEEVAMQITGPWYLSELRAADSLDFGVFPLPRDRKRATNIGGENLYILRTTPEREAASWTLAKYLVSPEVQRERLKATHQFPSRRSVAESDWMSDFLRKHSDLRTFYEVLSHGHTRPSIPGYFSVSQALGEELMQALQNKKPVADALDAAAKQAEAILQQQSAQ